MIKMVSIDAQKREKLMSGEAYVPFYYIILLSEVIFVFSFSEQL